MNIALFRDAHFRDAFSVGRNTLEFLSSAKVYIKSCQSSKATSAT